MKNAYSMDRDCAERIKGKGTDVLNRKQMRAGKKETKREI